MCEASGENGTMRQLPAERLVIVAGVKDLKDERQALFLDTWLSLLMLWEMSQGEIDFASGDQVVSFFKCLLLGKRGILAVWEGALSSALKSPPKKAKRTFLTRKFNG